MTMISHGELKYLFNSFKLILTPIKGVFLYKEKYLTIFRPD